MTRRFRLSTVLTAPILAFMVSEFLPGQPLQHALSPAWMTWSQFVLATPVVLWGGWPFFVRGWASVVNRHLNMFTLIALGVGAAYGFSVVATLAPGVFPASFRTHGGQVGVYFEPAAVIVVLVLLGQVLELRARSRTGAAIRKLLGLTPATARRVDAEGLEQDVALDQVQVGDRLRVRPGERVPVDGARPGRRHERGRVDADRRADPGREDGGQHGHRWHRERHRHLRHGGPAGRQRHAAGADCAPGQRGTAIACTDSAPRRHRRRLVRPDRHHRGRHHLRRVGGGGSRAALRACAGERGGRAHHRVPVRARPRDADVDHGRHGTRGRDRRAVAKCRESRGHGAGRRRRRGQDRDADRRQTNPPHRRSTAGVHCRRTSCGSRRVSRR